ncbi:MAG: class IV adenylate cyclase [Haloarculaceae archaeon]
MYEVEVKVRTPHGPVRERLADLGASREGTVRQADTYLNHPVRDFAETDEALRVRREERDGTERAELTYKGPLVEAESKTHEELETEVQAGDTAAAIFERLGFDPAATVEKTRERYRVGEFTVTLDTVEGLGEFVEVETDVPAESDVEAARERAYDVLADLGLDPAAQIRTSYLGLLLGDSPE